jgi:hypothetical protein
MLRGSSRRVSPERPTVHDLHRLIRTELGSRSERSPPGDRFRAGYVLNTGPVAYRLDDRIAVVPIDRLWHPVPRRK